MIFSIILSKVRGLSRIGLLLFAPLGKFHRHENEREIEQILTLETVAVVEKPAEELKRRLSSM